VELSPKEAAMPRLRNSIAIDATADEVWAVVGDLVATPEWIPGIVSAEIDGEWRLCRTADGNEIRERIFDYSAEDRSWSYEQSIVPLPIESSRGTLRVIPNESGAHVEWEAEFEAPEEVAAMVDGYYKQTLEALRRRVETGQSTFTM
jgi:polyketide cyclase/dehydrase/lipid transport protein